VTLCVPTVAVEAAVKVSVLAPVAGLVMVAGANVAITPLANPVTESATGELNPNIVAVRSESVFDFPRATVTELAPALNVNPPMLSVTITVSNGETLALLPVTMIG